MISFQVIMIILVVHWLADFALQTQEQALQKSTNPTALTYHVSTYTIVWFLISYCLIGNWMSSLLFALTTFIFHFWTDFITSRIGKTFWDKEDNHNGFVVVGFDQILHYIQLFLTYIWLS